MRTPGTRAPSGHGRIPKYALRAMADVWHTYEAWMNCAPEDGEEEGPLMDAHRDAITRLKRVASRDPAVTDFLTDAEIEDYLGTG